MAWLTELAEVLAGTVFDVLPILAVLLFGEVMTAPLLLSAAFILFGVGIARRG